MSKSSSVLQRMRRQILWQASLAVTVIVLTVVIVFAMTAAWTSNIVQTSGLQFQAEAWGFDGLITVNTDPIAAAPGDAGIIHMTVNNENQDLAAISVDVSKTAMEPEMQKRLYFYVDTQVTSNDEAVDRVYLNSLSSHTYMLFSGQTLTLSDVVHTDAQLKWHWVYDVLGYYVLGMEDPGAASVSVYEYLRPIEYDYDDATTVFDSETNELVSISGLTVAEFLADLTATDGYEGVIDENTTPIGGYYPVDVDEDGYGVYAYLCNYGEVEYATEYDTALGIAAANGAATERYTAKLTVTAQNKGGVVVEAATLSALKNAISEGVADIIQLTGDITIPATLKIPADSSIVLDLNGHKLTAETTDIAIQAEEGSSLTMMNGEITGTAGRGVEGSGMQLTMSNVDVTGFNQCIRILDNSGKSGLDSNVHLVDCTISGQGRGLLVVGNGAVSEAKTQVVVEKCTISSDGMTISGNSNSEADNKWGTDIQIISSTITSNAAKQGAAIFHPQMDSTLTIYDSELSGYTGLIIKGGSVNVVKSEITGTGAKKTPVPQANGASNTGDGIYIETNYGYDIALTISEASVIGSANGYSLQVDDPAATNVSVTIYSGQFKEPQPDAYIDEGSEQIGSNVTVKEN